MTTTDPDEAVRAVLRQLKTGELQKIDAGKLYVKVGIDRQICTAVLNRLADAGLIGGVHQAHGTRHPYVITDYFGG